jgi:Tol biopolymer transport system component
MRLFLFFTPTDSRQGKERSDGEREKAGSAEVRGLRETSRDRGDGTGQGEQYVRRHAKASSAGSTQPSSRLGGTGIGLIASAVLVIVSLLAFAALSGAAGAAAPVLIMGAATNPTYTTVHVEGTVNPEGEPGEWFFQVSSDGGASWERKNLGGQFGEPVEGTITELKAGATYKVRLAAYNYNEFVEVFSSELEFTTESVPAPTVTIDPVSTFTGTTAELSGSITANSPAGNPAAAEVKWHFECSPECATDNQGTVAAGQTGAVHATATGLQPNSEYTVRLVGENAGGPVNDTTSFTTSIVAPEAVTLPTVAVGPKMFLRGSVDPNNAPTEYWFEYGTTTAYGHLAPAGGREDGGSGRSHVVFHEVDGLAPSTTYHYQLVAEGPGGPRVGADLAVTTAPAAGQPASRADELVSPPLKNGGDIGFTGLEGMQAAPDGDSMLFQSRVSFGGGASGSSSASYRATRGTEGWTRDPVLPAGRSGIGAAFPKTLAASTDLSRLIIGSYNGATTEGLFTEPNELLMIESGGASTSMTVGQTGGFVEPVVDGGSPDLSRVVFTDAAPLTPDAVETGEGPQQNRGNLYGWTRDGLRLLDKLPDGTVPSQGASVGADSIRGFIDHAISTDSSRVFFTVPDDGSGSCLSAECARIYLREDAFGRAPETVEITANAGGPDAPGSYPAVFRGASADGTRAYFTSPAQLTSDATTGPAHEGNDLYEYRPGEGLTDLTVDHADPSGADVLGTLGVSDDGESVYFVAKGRLAEGAVAGGFNLYLHRTGHPTRFIAALGPGDFSNWERLSPSVGPEVQVTPDGRHVVFVSHQTDLNPTRSGQPTVYEYGVDTGLTCVSCRLDGAAPTGPSTVFNQEDIRLRSATGIHQRHSITDDGSRVFFDTSDALVPQDSNGREDVYVYEDGAAHLISSGRDSDDSTFVDATPDGADVFFLTRERLSGEDVDTNRDLYDARVGGRSVPPSVEASSCTSQECRGAASPPPPTSPPPTSAFSGAGNVATPKPPTRAENLRGALKSCRSKHGGKAKRKKCEATARKRFAKHRGSK